MKTYKVLPKHLAIIPDGNRRWARKYGWKAWEGHRMGARVFEEIAKDVFRRGIRHLSLWTISEGNLEERDREETFELNKVIAEAIERMAVSSWVNKEYEVRIRVPGEWRPVFSSIDQFEREYKIIDEAEKRTRHHAKNFLYFFTVYSAKAEVREGVKKILEISKKHPEVEITNKLIRSTYYIPNLPPVDLLIRTGLKKNQLMRVSEGFMAPYFLDTTEIWSTTVLWPEFEEKDLAQALYEYGLSQLAAKET